MGLSPFAIQDLESVRLWLQRFRDDADALFAFRTLLTEDDWNLVPVVLNDAEVLDEIAWRLHRRLLWTAARVEMQQSYGPELEQPNIPVEPPPDYIPIPVEPEAPPPDPPTFPPSADLAAILAAKAEAALLGLPFCDVCQLLALASNVVQEVEEEVELPESPFLEPEEESPFDEDADLVQLAEMQQAAAEDGVPFCEQCAQEAAAES